MKAVWTEIAKLNLLALTKDEEWLKENFNYEINNPDKSIPFINYILQFQKEKDNYKKASDEFNERINRNYIDDDNDFLIGNSNGFLLKWDFVFVDTHLFCQVAEYYSKYNSYCLSPKDSIEYKEFYGRELHRRKFGYTAKCKLYIKDIYEYFNPKTTEQRKKELVHDLHITGDHYTYLNYGRIERTPNEEERKNLDAQGLFKTKTINDFPRFWDGDYWSFKIDNFVSLNEFNDVTAKARRKGYSYKRGNSTANTFNLNKNITIINVAHDIRYLTDIGSLTYMTKICLDWFEDKTYWRRGYLSETLEEIESGYKLKHEGNKGYGFRSKILSYATNRNTSVAVGKKAIKINVEEGGANPSMPEFLEVTFSNIESGAMKIGGISIWGTGGTKGANWQYFEHIFNNPLSINALPLENIFGYNKRHLVSGWFHPNVLCYEPYMCDGNSLLFDSYIHDKKDKEKARLNKTYSRYIIHAAQRANTPEEAFINTQENIFASPALNVWINDLKVDSKYHFYTDGWYVKDKEKIKFVNKYDCLSNKIFKVWHEFITDVPHKDSTDIHGCVREYFNPYTIDGVIPKGLYEIVVDPYGVNKLQKEVTAKNSLYSIQVWSNSGIVPHIKENLVAEYAGRLDRMEENDELLLYFCIRWGATALVETNRGETISNFRKWKMLKYLQFDPRDYLTNDNFVDIKNKIIGININGTQDKLDGLTYLSDYLNTKIGISEDNDFVYTFQRIYSLPFLLELQRYTSEGNFDRISTAIIRMFQRKKNSIANKKNKGTKQNNSSTYNRLMRS